MKKLLLFLSICTFNIQSFGSSIDFTFDEYQQLKSTISSKYVKIKDITMNFPDQEACIDEMGPNVRWAPGQGCLVPLEDIIRLEWGFGRKSLHKSLWLSAFVRPSNSHQGYETGKGVLIERNKNIFIFQKEVEAYDKTTDDFVKRNCKMTLIFNDNETVSFNADKNCLDEYSSWPENLNMEINGASALK